MLSVLTRAGCFIAMIILGYVLKLLGVFKEEDFSVIARVVLKITLPAAIVVSMSGYTIDVSMLSIALIGLAGCGLQILLAFLLNLGRGRERQAFAITNVSGYNIGCFTMPFAQSFLGPVGVVTCSLFDIGNAGPCLGGGYSIAAAIKNGRGFSLKPIAKTLFTSVPFVTYLIMIVLNLAKLRLPGPILDFAELVANANVFASMLMLGIGFELKIERSQIGDVLRIVSLHYAVAAALAALCYFLLPFELDVRKALVILLLSPIGSTAPAYTEELGGDVALSSAINSITIILSIVLIVAVLSLA